MCVRVCLIGTLIELLDQFLWLYMLNVCTFVWIVCKCYVFVHFIFTEKLFDSLFDSSLSIWANFSLELNAIFT